MEAKRQTAIIVMAAIVLLSSLTIYIEYYRNKPEIIVYTNSSTFSASEAAAAAETQSGTVFSANICAVENVISEASFPATDNVSHAEAPQTGKNYSAETETVAATTASASEETKGETVTETTAYASFATQQTPSSDACEQSSSNAQTTEHYTAKPETTRVPTTQALLVNVNTAPLSELVLLNGIGEAKGQAIIDYRTENGPFLSVDELLNVRGIGEKTLEKIRPCVAVQ